MLRPILRRFVDAFSGPPDVPFWSHVAYRSQEYCGQDDLSGWITAFCVWSTKGEWMPRRKPTAIPMQPLVPPPPVRERRRAPEEEAAAARAAEKGMGGKWRAVAGRLSTAAKSPFSRKVSKPSRDVAGPATLENREEREQSAQERAPESGGGAPSQSIMELGECWV